MLKEATNKEKNMLSIIDYVSILRFKITAYNWNAAG